MKAPYKTHIEGKNSLKAGGSVSYTGNPPGRREQNKNPTNTQKKIDEKMLNRRADFSALTWPPGTHSSDKKGTKRKKKKKMKKFFLLLYSLFLYSGSVYVCLARQYFSRDSRGHSLSLSIFTFCLLKKRWTGWWKKKNKKRVRKTLEGVGVRGGENRWNVSQDRSPHLDTVRFRYHTQWLFFTFLFLSTTIHRGLFFCEWCSVEERGSRSIILKVDDRCKREKKIGKEKRRRHLYEKPAALEIISQRRVLSR